MKSDKAIVRELIQDAIETMMEAGEILVQHGMEDHVNQVQYILDWMKPLYKQMGKVKSF